MVHLAAPAPDNGHFTTLDVRPRSPIHDGCRGLTSRTISFPKGNYTHPPNIAGGFAMLDLAVRVPSYSTSRSSSRASTSSASQGSEQEERSKRQKQWKMLPIRANIVGSHITSTSFHIGLETWSGGIMNAASATWIEHKFGAKDCQFGQFDTLDVLPIWKKRQRKTPARTTKRKKQKPKEKHPDDEEKSETNSPVTESTVTSRVFSTTSPILPASSSATSVSSSSPTSSDDEMSEDEAEDNLPTTYHHTVHFSRPYSSPPTVITWLNRIDLLPTNASASKWRPFRISSTTANTSPASTKLVLTSSAKSKQESATLNGAAVCYIAFPPSKARVASGHITVTSSTRIRSFLTGRVRFPQDRFKNRVPTVLAALSGFECPGDIADLRVGVTVTWTSNDAFGWEILGPQVDDEAKGGRWSVTVSWIALGFA